MYITVHVPVSTFSSKDVQALGQLSCAKRCCSGGNLVSYFFPFALPEHHANLPQPLPNLRANARVLSASETLTSSANNRVNSRSVRSAQRVPPLKIKTSGTSVARLASLPRLVCVFVFLSPTRLPLQFDFVPFYCCLHRPSLLSAPMPVNRMYITLPALRGDSSSSSCLSFCKCAHADL